VNTWHLRMQQVYCPKCDRYLGYVYIEVDGQPHFKAE
jgi:hypothetical protein